MPDWLHAFLTFQVVAVLAGGIAYLGNHLGRRIGKRKMTVFKMRPRHTSNFMTVVTGIVIAWTTLGVSSIFSENVRQLITGVSALQEERAQLEQEIKDLQRKLLTIQIVWDADSPVVTGILNPSLGREALRQQIMAALGAANLEIIKANNDVAKKLKQPVLGADDFMLTFNATDIGRLLERMADKTEVTGIEIWATQNCVYRTPAPIRFELTPVTRVFTEGEVILKRAVQPADPRFLVLWYDFLDELKTTATDKGMIQSPNNSLGGGITNQDLVRVSEQISTLRAPGTLVAVARRDLYQTSPLDVKIEVRQ